MFLDVLQKVSPLAQALLWLALVGLSVLIAQAVVGAIQSHLKG